MNLSSGRAFRRGANPEQSALPTINAKACLPDQRQNALLLEAKPLYTAIEGRHIQAEMPVKEAISDMVL